MSQSCFCDHCGLPVPGAVAAPEASPRTEPQYCCFGCRFAAEIAQGSSLQGDIGGAFFRLALSVFLSLNVMIFTMLLWTQDVYGDAATGTASAVSMWAVSRYLCMLFSLPVLYLLGMPVAAEAWKSLRRGVPSTDLLLIVGTVAAYLYSIVSTLRAEGPVYFEVGCAVLVLVTLGRWLEARGKQQAAAALESLEKLLPEKVQRWEGARLGEIPLDSVRIGDRLFVRAGERIPTDGRIVGGTASIDTQLLTGESLPHICETGDAVIGGTLNLDGALTIEVAAAPRDGTWRRLLDCIREARLQKGRYERLADRLAAWFLPLVIVAALGAFGFHAFYGGLDRGLLAALAVVLIACPCALGLATPMAVWAALGTAAQGQVLFRNGEALERLARARVLAFDKTGTLTDGRPAVARLIVLDQTDADELIARTSAAVAASNHDLSRALYEYCRAQSVGKPRACEVRTLPGRGLEASFNDLAEPVLLGNERLMHERLLAVPPNIAVAIRSMADEGLSLVCVGWLGVVRGVFGLSEELRPDVRDTLSACRGAGLRVCVLTGDHAARGRAIGELLDVDVRAELLPEDKLAAVAALRETFGPTVMIGDGINDAPALSAADVGIALGCGADVSRESGDVCLLGDDLAKIPWAIDLARRTIRIVKQNLFWSFFYNIVGIGLAAAGLLNPVWAAVAMTVSGLTVVANSLRLATKPTLNQGAATASQLAKPSPETAPPAGVGV